MKPHLSRNDEVMFYKYLEKCNVYFEYGSGGSTYQAALKENIQHIYSVESDLQWHNKLKNLLSDKTHIHFIYNEMNTLPNTWGHPGPNCSDDKKKQYSNYLGMLNNQERDKIDFIFIDGRFRVSCCLKCFKYINDNTFIAFDDFLNRKQYHIVLDYYNIVEKTNDNRMVILKKKQDINNIPDDIINKYELIKD